MPAVPVVTGGRAPLRIGVLGCGGVAVRRMLPAMARTPLVEVAAIASRDRERAERTAALFDATPVHGYQALLLRDDVDAVYLPLPPALHARWAAEALRAGKHALVEKPMTTGAREARQLVDLARAESLLLMEAFAFLHHGQHAAVSRLVASGRIGEVRTVTAEFGFPPRPPDDFRYRPELGGGALLDAGVYPLRAAQLLLGPSLSVVGAVLDVDPTTGVDVRGDALLRACDGATAHLSCGFTHAYRCCYALWGSAGRIVLHRAFTPPPEHRPVLRVERQDHTEELVLPAEDQFANLVTRFATMALIGEDPAPEHAAAVRQARLVDAVRERAR